MSPRRQRADDLRLVFDPDDDDLDREVHERAQGAPDPPRSDAEPLAPTPPRARGEDEVVCRRCRLVVPRRAPDGVVQLLCDDCRW